MKLFIKLLTFLIFLLCLNPLMAQTNADTTTVWQITTFDDNEFVGIILSETETIIEFKTASIGIITLQKNLIKKRQKLRSDASTNGLLWAENPMSSRYFWANSGYNLKKGDGYYQNTWVLFNHVHFGLSDNFSLGGGTMPLFLFAGAPTPIWISPKASFPIQKDKINIGAGMLLGGFFSTDESVAFGFGYGTATFGSSDTNVSVGLGYGLANDKWANRPTITLSGMIRTGKRGYIITENYFIGYGSDEVVLLSLGGRFVGKKIILDYGGIYPSGTGSFVIIPWLSISLPF